MSVYDIVDGKWLEILNQGFINWGSSHTSTGTILLFPYCNLDQSLDM